MKIAVFPGSFDPITKGHTDIVERALPLFDQIIVAVGINSTKKYFFSLEQRLDFLEATFAKQAKIKIDTYEQLTVDYCQEQGAEFMLRGIRNASDFVYENTIAQLNRVVGKNLETVFLISSAKYNYYSSTIVREIIKGGGDISPFVPKAVLDLIKLQQK